METLPKDRLPEAFNDIDRLNFLYAPIRSKSNNSKDWETKITLWTELIKLYCSTNKVYTLSEETLKSALRYNGRTPNCLHEVVQEMIKSGELIDLQHFLKEDAKTWGGWLTNMTMMPLTWSLEKFKDRISNIEKKTYVPIYIIKEDAEDLLLKLANKYKCKVISLSELIKNEDFEVAKSKEYKLLFHYLHKNKKVDLLTLEKDINECDKTLIKFFDGLKLTPINEMDLAIHSLKQNERNLTETIKEMENNILKCVDEAKQHLKENHKQLAKNCLRRKHEIEKRVNKKVNALWNVQCLIEMLTDAQEDSKIWESYKQAVSMYESVNKKGLIDEADDTMIKLGEVMDVQSDVNGTLSNPVIDIDDDLLEKELEELLNESEEKTVEKDLELMVENLDLNLPDVPSTNISINENISICSQNQ